MQSRVFRLFHFRSDRFDVGPKDALIDYAIFFSHRCGREAASGGKKNWTTYLA
jgi:hypothetical protein